MPKPENTSSITSTGYFRSLGVFSFFLLGIGAILFLTVLQPWYNPAYIPVFFYILFVNMLSHGFLLRAWKRDPSRFITWFMAASTFKIFMYLIFLIVYFFIRRNIVIQLAIVFLILYIFFAAFELGMLLKKFKKNGQN
jgi:hypothetical protein